jgi:hypothetical protein
MVINQWMRRLLVLQLGASTSWLLSAVWSLPGAIALPDNGMEAGESTALIESDLAGVEILPPAGQGVEPEGYQPWGDPTEGIEMEGVLGVDAEPLSPVEAWTVDGMALDSGATALDAIAVADEWPEDAAPPMISLDAIAPEGDPMGQVTSVNQLSDVSPTDWAFQALQSLIDRYGCIAGYPDGTFRGNQAMSRFEFAAGLNACLEGLAVGLDGLGTGDLSLIEQLQSQFAVELAGLRGRLDILDGQIALLESQQFSTTTRLFGQLVIGVQGRTANRADFFPVDGVRDTDDPSTQINLITNAQLSLLTQFNPSSLLLIGLQGGSGSTAPRLTNDTRLSYEGSTDNSLQLSDLTFRQRISDNVGIVVGPRGVNAVNVFRGANRVESAGFGPLSAFAQRNPVISVGGGDAGLGFDWQIAPWMSLQGVYSTSNGPDPARGLFGGDFGDTVLGTQVTFAPTDTIDIALNYVNAYTRSGNLRNSIGDSQVTAASTPLNTNAFGATVAWQATPRFRIGSWAGYTNSQIPGRSGEVETVNWMAFLNLVDVFGSNDLLGLYVGQPPKITNSTLPLGQNLPDRLAGGPGLAGGQPGTTTHVELFYRNRITDNIAITPGFILVFNPGNTPDSETVFIGVLRTTLTF